MQREEKGKGKGGKGAGIDRCRAITNLSISRVVIGVDGAQSFRTEPGACTLGKIISVRPYNTALLRACGDTEGLGPETSRQTWSLLSASITMPRLNVAIHSQKRLRDSQESAILVYDVSSRKSVTSQNRNQTDVHDAE